MKKISVTLLFLLLLGFISAQQFDFDDQSRINRIKSDVELLASDSILGREAGTKGEIMAMNYLAQEFQKMELKPIMKDNTYFQEFEFIAGATYQDGTSLIVGDNVLKPGEDFYPLSFSASKSAKAELMNIGYGLETKDQQTNDYYGRDELEGNIFLMELSVPGGATHYEDYAEEANIKQKIKTAEKHGASGIVIVNNDKHMRDPEKKISLREIKADIPVVFVKGDAGRAIKQDIGKQVKLNVNIRKIRKEAYNVVGLINNDAPYTVVLGAHYDHLGMGGPSSRYVGPPKVHNGADDNASGVAMILELARKLKSNENKNLNFLILAFSAEEHGLVGSSHFVQSTAYKKDKITAMLNFDMVGRMEENKLHISGTGTSPAWKDLIGQSNDHDFNIKTSESGTGGSDQMNFYLDSIPVLFYFTGIHDDYHKPSDDADKLNYASMLKINETIEQLISEMPHQEKLKYNKTESDKSKRRPADFSVTLGVMPDHSFDGQGMRIANVIQGRVSEEAGLKDGDIVIQMGEHEIKDMMSYMKALSEFEKGSKTTVKIKRGNKILEKQVQFK